MGTMNPPHWGTGSTGSTLPALGPLPGLAPGVGTRLLRGTLGEHECKLGPILLCWERVGRLLGPRDGSDTPKPLPMAGVDFKMKTIEVDGIKVRIQIWDTAGQERYQTITKQYYRRAQGIFLVYDISSERSYQHIVKWASDVDELAREYGMDFYETSACSNLNIKESFTRLTELVLQAHRKELEGLRAPPRTPTLARLEDTEPQQRPPSSEENPKSCWC
ncbi:ras-related protein Rab-15 isoform X2 [Pogoniulus pusillus]|uniref:ras-related protein Rab-15 isoform X2 n=1 Tax=Pogoniulus pusillus TaxID=488313 RepID=UPI0030B93BD6